MEQVYEQLSAKKYAQKWGVILGVVFIIIALLTFILTDPSEPFTLIATSLNIITYVALGIVIFKSIKEHRTDQDGFITFGKAFVNGLLVALIASLMVAVVTAIYLTLIDPGYVDVIREQAMAGAQIDETSDPEAAEMAEWMVNLTTSPVMLAVFSFFGNFIIGVIFSLVISAILKNNRGA